MEDWLALHVHREQLDPSAGQRTACRSTRVEGGHFVLHGRVGVERGCTGPRPHTYRLARLRFAQDAFNRFDMAFLAAALQGFRFLCVLG